ncbi:MAG: hypothetical protein JWM96_1099, partial [Alphaproteobacteria bacterium]|nr:hypothetical protein [Alphaproteobacteria bacterium]
DRYKDEEFMAFGKEILTRTVTIREAREYPDSIFGSLPQSAIFQNKYKEVKAIVEARYPVQHKKGNFVENSNEIAAIAMDEVKKPVAELYSDYKEMLRIPAIEPDDEMDPTWINPARCRAFCMHND